jgi:hypothetical protein
MSVLHALDATRLCSRPVEPNAWALATPVAARPVEPVADFSWLAMLRNPRAVVVTGLFGSLLAADRVAAGITRRAGISAAAL